MKVNELREKLSKLKKEEIIKIASEFYKLIPKSKKEDYSIDDLVDNPNKTKKRVGSGKSTSLAEIEIELRKFIEYAKQQYYLYPNRVVPKKERATWRFKVKRWYKELIDLKRENVDVERQSQLLFDLYQLICESCGYQYFTAYDPFQSIGIDQTMFYRSTITLLQESQGKVETLKRSIELIVDNYLNRYTLYSDLMIELINTFEVPNLKYKGIEVVEELISANNFQEMEKDERFKWHFSNESYHKREKNNNLSELGLRLYINLFETKEGIEFFEKHYYSDNQEIKLYVLISILFGYGKKEEIVEELEKAIKQGIEPRNNLTNLLAEIKMNDKLPKYMR